VIDGADAGHRDYIWLKRMVEDNDWKGRIEQLTLYKGPPAWNASAGIVLW